MLRHLVTMSLFAVTLSSTASAQSLAYQDATTSLGAVGMMKMTLRGAEYFQARCAAQFPELQQEMRANLEKWQSKEATAIRKAEARWPSMVEQEPKFSQMLELMDNAIQGQLDMLGKMPPDVGRQLYSEMCRKHFADLASGVWRQRTPNAYNYLDALEQ